MTDRELLDRKGHEVNDDLPPLPEPVEVLDLWGNDCPVYNREQMRAYAIAYARAAVLAERLATLEAVNALIKDGPFKGNGCDDLAQNNGVILAANLLASRVYAIRKGTT